MWCWCSGRRYTLSCHAGSICRIRQDVQQLIVESRADMVHISGDNQDFREVSDYWQGISDSNRQELCFAVLVFRQGTHSAAVV